MTAFILRRLMQIVITFLIIITLVFFLYRFAPGDPTSMIISPKLSPEDRARLRAEFGLDDPLHTQYFKFLNNLSRLNFGNSLTSGRPVLDIVKERVGPTLLLFLPANLFGFLLGKKIGEIMAWIRNTWRERALTLFSLICYTVFFPWFAVLLIWIFGYQLNWFPLGGMISAEAWAHNAFNLWQKFLDVAWHLILPLTTLVVVRFAGPALVMRSSMLESLRSDFVQVARAKGLSERRVRYHAARNSMLPMTTSFILSFAYAFSGSVLVEQVFSWPGIGQKFVSAALQQDFPVVQASFVILAFLVLVANLVADIVYSMLDPRVSYD